jgi:hypothetical protein
VLAVTTLGQVHLDAYLEPDVHSAGLRRGRVLQLLASERPGTARSAWTVTATRAFAQVVPPGRHARDIRGDWDAARPFLVEGDIDDETLVGVVLFIRSDPAIPRVREGLLPSHVAGHWPVSVISRRGDTFVVGLQTGEFTGHTVSVEWRDGAWVVTDFAMWIA